MRRLAYFLPLLFVVGCASSTSSSQGADIARTIAASRTFNWLSQTDNITITAPESEKRRIDGVIKASLEKRFSAKGLRRVETKPDLLVAYYVGAEEMIVVERMAYAVSGDQMESLGTESRSELRGHLLIDVVDAASQTLLWRSGGNGPAKEQTQDKVDESLHEAIGVLLKKFPTVGGVSTSTQAAGM